MSTSTEPRRFAPLTAGSGTTELHTERQAARALGYAEGWSNGQRAAAAYAAASRVAMERAQEAAAADARSAVERALGALSTASRQLVSSTIPLLDEAGDMLLEAAIALARAVIDTELAAMDDAALQALRRALRPLPADGLVTVRVNPEDHARLREMIGGTSESFEGHDLHLVADASLRSGDAIAEQAGSIVDVRIDAALRRALDAVRLVGEAS